MSSVAFSPDGTRIVSGSDDNTVRLWDAATGQPIGQPLTGHTDAVYSVAFSPDGTRIASGSRDNTVRLWDAATGQPIGQPLTGHTDAVTSVAFSPDGKRIVSGSADNTVRLWDADTGQPIGQPLTGHTGRGEQRGVQPRRHTASPPAAATTRCGCGTRTPANPIGDPLTGHTDAVYSVAFSPDGKRIVSGSADKTLRLWPAYPDATIGVVRQAHHQHEPPAVAGLGVARHRLHRSLSGTCPSHRTSPAEGVSCVAGVFESFQPG